ncbi:uncharacterized protein LOC125188644 isoform X1 [Salvia hispanica]|uniref:uncharacterized protein LOC125188644 isoform X1 n=1 Tax=Salvia hispanica TaxID=49212 RepID=UPI002009DA7F|nr:uncharacterized protein LOC125188644 isoform X1 [Salvia hispanica]
MENIEIKSPATMLKQITVVNKHGQKLDGLLHDTGSTNIVVLCHAFRSTKEHFAMVKLAHALETEGVTAFRFDFSLTEYTEDSYYSGNYDSEIEDLRAVVEYFSTINRPVAAVLGHSKGANIVLEFASKYHNVGAVINVSGRYDPWHINLKNRNATSEEEVKDVKQLNSSIDEEWLTMDPRCKVLTVHGTADNDVALDEAYEIGKVAPNHQLKLVDGADHTYESRLDQLAAAVVPFAKECCFQSLA